MKKVIIIGCYFGQKRKDYKTWLKSCEYNSTIDWLIFSDSDWGNTPPNVKIIKKTFNEIKEKIQSKFEFKITLNTPYKLCDYKPAYGYIFEEYIEEYDFWGYCDFDMIFGDIRKFLTDEILQQYDKIFKLGHLSLYKNTPGSNTLFKQDLGNYGTNYKEVFTTNEIKVFDEIKGINLIYELNNKKIYNEPCFIDLSKFSKQIIVTKNEDTKNNYSCQTVLFDQGKLYYIYKEKENINKEEIIYVHFSGKTFDSNGEEKYILTKNGVQKVEKDIEWKKIDNNFLWITLKINKLKKINFKIKRKIKKYINRRKEINERKKQETIK